MRFAHILLPLLLVGGAVAGVAAAGLLAGVAAALVALCACCFGAALLVARGLRTDA